MKLIALSFICLFSIVAVFGHPNTKYKKENIPFLFSKNNKFNNENVKVSVYSDGNFRASLIFIRGVLEKIYNRTSDNEEDKRSYTKYFYTKTGKILKTEDWINGKKLPHGDKELYQHEIDLTAKYLSSANFLKKKGIQIPLPGLVYEQIKDTASILEIGDKFNDFKKETTVSGEFKTIKFIGFNKRIDLEPTLLILGANQLINDYELTLRNNYFFKEIYKIGADEKQNIVSEEFRREYFYTGNRLTKLITTSNFVYKDGKTDDVVNELKFVYKNIRATK